jgi:hypothetical protein
MRAKCLLLVLLLLTLVSTTASAAYWARCAWQNDGTTIYVDLESIRFARNEGKLDEDTALCWTKTVFGKNDRKVYKGKAPKHMLTHHALRISSHQMANLDIVIYDVDGGVLARSSKPSKFDYVIPDSGEEQIYSYVTSYIQSHYDAVKKQQ